MKKPITTIVALLFALGALVHLYRFYAQFQIMIGTHNVPIWASGVAVLVGGTLSYGLFKESKEKP